MKHAILILSLSLLSSCATGTWNGNMYTPKRVAGFQSFISDPAAANAYLERTVEPARLKRWKRAISDDKIVIQYDSESGRGIAY